MTSTPFSTTAPCTSATAAAAIGEFSLTGSADLLEPGIGDGAILFLEPGINVLEISSGSERNSYI